jgi:cellobiose-specific phosphotransferase system component IIA
MKLFKKHLFAARQHLHNSVQAYENGDVLEANLLLAAANEELERAQLYS